MIESMFYFFVLLAIGVLMLGILTRSGSFVALGAVLFLLLGVVLSTDGIVTNQLDSDAYAITSNGDNTDINANFVTLTTSNDTLVNIMQQLFLWGGFGLLSVSLAVFYVRYRRRDDETVRETML